MEMEDYGELLADTFGGGKPTNSPRVKYGTVTKVNGSTLDVSLAGGTITGVCMTVSCAGAKVGDRVVLLVDGALVTCLGIVATSDNARYVTSDEGMSWGNISGKPTNAEFGLKAYPVGSIYLSVNSTNPKDLFGGTWQQLSNRFLVGVGSSYSNGKTGGASSYTPKGSVGSHTLTLDEIPKHSHQVLGGWGAGSKGDGCFRTDQNNPNVWWQATGNQGGGKGHNHGFTGTAQTILPPYLAVYMWKRTA